MAGKMHKEELEEGGEWYGVRKDMEEIGKKAGAVVKVEPFDQYQGPKGKVYFGTQYVGELWVGNFEKPDVWYFKPEINIKLLHSVKSAKMSKYVMVNYLYKLKEALPSHKPFAVIPGEKPANWSTPKLKREQQKSFLHLVKSKYQIQILAADIIDIKPQLKQKKAEDKEKKTDDKIQGMQPLWDKAKMRVMESSAYAGGYEMTVDVPTPASFFKSKENWKDMFVTQLHPFIRERLGRWMDRPYVKKDERAKQGMINAQAMWHFDDAFLAYALGLDLSKWRVSADVVDKNKIASRMLLAEKAFKDLQGFRDVSIKKLKLRSQDKEEKDKIWKEEFMPEWVKLTEKWKEQGIDYHPLAESKRAGKESAMGFYQKIQSRYVIVNTSYF